MKLASKKAIVTGAGRSIGRAIALKLAQEGADVLITYCNNDKGAFETLSMIEQTGAKAFAMQADFSTPQGVSDFSKKAIAELGAVDILVNNAGVPNRTGFSISPEEMLSTFQLNTFAPFLLSQHVANHMIEKHIEGSIIHISSIAVDFKKPAQVAYSSSKAALNSIMESSAVHLAKHNIRVNAVAPGVVSDGMNAERLADNPELQAHYESIIPLGRIGKPEDIANMVAFIASDDASWITGKVIDVDGGHGTLGSHAG